MSTLYSLDLKDIIKGAIVSAGVAFIYTTYNFVGSETFNLFHTDWQEVINVTFKASYLSFVSYIIKNALTDSSGKFMGKI
jgi:hypothetical protein